MPTEMDSAGSLYASPSENTISMPYSVVEELTALKHRMGNMMEELKVSLTKLDSVLANVQLLRLPNPTDDSPSDIFATTHTPTTEKPDQRSTPMNPPPPQNRHTLGQRSYLPKSVPPDRRARTKIGAPETKPSTIETADDVREERAPKRRRTEPSLVDSVRAVEGQDSMGVGDSTDAEPFTEPKSRMRLRTLSKAPENIATLLDSRRFVSLSDVHSTFQRGDDSALNWYTIGVIGEKSSPRTSSNNKKYLVIKLTDLAGHIVSVFLFDAAFETHWKEVVGSVIVVANAEVVPATDTYTTVGLSVSNPDKYMTLGMSADMARCKGTRRDGQECTVVLDARHGEYCDFHAESAYKKKKTARQEFAVSDAPYHIGPPQPQRKRDAAARGQLARKTYRFENGVTVSTGDAVSGAVNVGRKGMSSEQKQKVAEKQDESLRRLLQRTENTLALTHLAKAAGLGQATADVDESLLDADAIKKIGFDPFQPNPNSPPKTKSAISPSKQLPPKPPQPEDVRPLPSTKPRSEADAGAKKKLIFEEDFEELVIVGMPSKSGSGSGCDAK
ncbi:hypothetical protein M427DRAFT_118640 [Gonapodya prolifera JEL478]|uniref:Uncharacterized protein n=1 Tax=Gonapodya prolifera (strain JEL478) TaxID=1344416 RepID=A0A139AXY3_GONPJ|nr:hypothetical protein M427DRAFT_118640 [Gonapodya prolifera JEL478]|eukprot:KXS21611.1 hypothetical protein M427DRAFT_118640 [Gonapodya prolifera JEL478]